MIRNAELNEIYGFQIFAGKRTPSRDKLICLCIAMGLTLDETQATLKIAGLAPLYPKNKKDSVILFGIQHGKSIGTINEMLFELSEQTLN